MKFTDETRRANCQACLLASCMKDCMKCPFYGSWSPSIYTIWMNESERLWKIRSTLNF